MICSLPSPATPDACFAGGQHHAVANGGRNIFNDSTINSVADTVARVAGQHDKINAHIGSTAGVFCGGKAAAAHLPQRTIVAFCGLWVVGLQIDAYHAARQAL